LFQILRSLTVDHPILLPQQPDLLRIPGTKARFHEIHNLQLTAWTLSSNVSRQRAFQMGLPIWRHEDAENPQTRYTLRIFDCTTHGAGLARSLLIQRL
jgi:hypothetical protein